MLCPFLSVFITNADAWQASSSRGEVGHFLNTRSSSPDTAAAFPLFPSTAPYFALSTYHPLRRSPDITSALHLQGACTRGGVGVALYTITRESTTSRGAEDRKSILWEKDTRLGGPSSHGSTDISTLPRSSHRRAST